MPKDQFNEQMKRTVPFWTWVESIPDWLKLAGVGALLLWLGNFLFALLAGDNSGTFGDSFGVINSLFTGFAFIGVVWSMSMQRNELRLMKQEREETKQLLQIQQDNIEDQNAAMNLQRFEATFFQMLSSFNEVVQGMAYMDGINVRLNSQGHNAFGIYLVRMQETYLEFYRDEDNDTPEHRTHRKDIGYEMAYESLFKYNERHLGRYFRNIFMILQLIDRASINDKKFYAKMFRSQLTANEATLLAINRFSPKTTPDFDDLIEKYEICKNANMDYEMFDQMYERIPNMVFGREWVEIEEMIDQLHERKRVTKSLFK